MFGIPYRKIAKAVDIGLDAITYINRQVPSNLDEIEQCKKRMIGESYGLSARAWNRVTDEKLDQMNALQLTTIGAIGIDKARDMEGHNRPVFNLVTVVQESQKATSQIQSQIAALKARKLALQAEQTNVVS